MDNKFIRLRQVLENYYISKTTFYRLRKKHKIPFYKIGKESRMVWYNPIELDALFDRIR